MAEGDKKHPTGERISDEQRFRFIGFDAFPNRPWLSFIAELVVWVVVGNLLRVLLYALFSTWWFYVALAIVGVCFWTWFFFIVRRLIRGLKVAKGQLKDDIFSSSAEEEKARQAVVARRSKDHTLRDDCTLLEERVSMGERIVMAISSLVILAALFLPWYSAYTEVPVESKTPVQTPEEVVDTLAVAIAGTDSLATPDSLTAMFGGEEVEESTELPEGAAVDTPALTVLEPEAPPQEERSGIATHQGERANEQIITAQAARVRTIKDYTYLSGLGTFTALGSVGGPVFSSGFVLILTGVLMLIFGLLCVALPILNLYSIFGLKGNPDEVALKLKKFTRLNWLPLIIFVVVLVLSFVGANYGFDSAESYTSLGDGYSVGVFLGSLSWGIFVAMAASILIAVKGIEI